MSLKVFLAALAVVVVISGEKLMSLDGKAGVRLQNCIGSIKKAANSTALLKCVEKMGEKIYEDNENAGAWIGISCPPLVKKDSWKGCIPYYMTPFSMTP